MNSDEIRAWAQSAMGQLMLHVGTRTVVRLTKFYDGENDVYTSPINNLPVKGPVVEAFTGSTFVANPDLFIRLTEKEGEFYAGTEASLANFLREIAKAAGEMGVRPATMSALVIVALRTQASKLEAEHQKMFGQPSEGPPETA